MTTVLSGIVESMPAWVTHVFVVGLEDHQQMKTISPEIKDVASIVGSDNREG